MKVGVYTNAFREFPIEEAMRKIQAAGIQMVELGCGEESGFAHCDPQQLLADENKLAAFRGCIADHGLEISALSCHGNPVSPNEATRELSVRSMRNAVLLAEKLGLMRPLRLEKGPLLRTLVVSIPLGLLFSLDYWTFGAWLPGTAVQTSAAAGLTVWGWASAILYGGVMEELFMRLFLMSLLAFLGWKLFFQSRETAPEGVIAAANVLAAL